MGFIKAFSGSIGGTFADQWIDYYAPRHMETETIGLIAGTKIERNRGRGANTKGSSNIISNGSKIIVPEGMALLTVQNGEFTGLITEVGGFIYNSDNVNAKSIFAGNGFMDSIVKQSWDRFKFGGIPSEEQLLFYVNLKEIPNNKFGTQSEIYWDDKFLNTQVGAITRGSYSLKIVDPLAFVKNFVPLKYLGIDSEPFDFADFDNNSATQLFNEVVSSLSQAFSIYTGTKDRITKIQSDQVGFAKSLSQAVEENYEWKSNRGLEITKSAIVSIEYDEDTKELLKDVKRADSLKGSRGNSFLQQSVARGMQSAGENGDASNMAFMGMGLNASNGVMSGLQQEETKTEDATEKLLNMKKLLDADIITQEEFDKVKKDLLGF